MVFNKTKNIESYRRPSEILRLVEAFERCTLPPVRWNKKAYLTIAFWYLYLNSLPEAERLMRESATRYRFEYGFINLFPTETATLSAIGDYMKIYKGKKSFVALGNMVLRRFGGQNRKVEVRKFARDFYSNPLTSESKRETACR